MAGADGNFHHTHLGRPSWVSGDIFTRSAQLGHLHAGEPWEFTRHILFEFQNSDIDEEHPEWMVSWFAGVSILRTIGHVLRNVDRKRSDETWIIVDDFWSDVQNNRITHWIFFDFIQRERNNILKEFSFGASLPENSDDRRILVYDTHDDWDGTQLFREAVYWWRAQLEHIDREIGKISTITI